MRDLMLAIQDRLDTLNYSTYIAIDEAILPFGITFPAIGIKDGAVSRKECMGNRLDETDDIILYISVDVSKNDILTSENGLLSIVEEIHTILDEYLLANCGDIESAFCRSEEGSVPVQYDDFVLQQKTLVYEYQRQVNRP
jgi:hypothetical protein